MTPTLAQRFDVPAEPDRVREVRRWLRGLPGVEAVVDDVVLLACELVTNAVRHSDSAKAGADGRPGRVSIEVFATAEAVRVEVTDAGAADRPHFAADDLRATCGRGLRLVDTLAEGRWGVRDHDTGERTVWFEIRPEGTLAETGRAEPYRAGSSSPGSTPAKARLRPGTTLPSPDPRGPLMDHEPLMTPAEVAALFRVDPKTVTRWATEGRLTYVRTLGGHRRYRETDIRALLTDRSDPGEAHDSNIR